MTKTKKNNIIKNIIIFTAAALLSVILSTADCCFAVENEGFFRYLSFDEDDFSECFDQSGSADPARLSDAMRRHGITDVTNAASLERRLGDEDTHGASLRIGHTDSTYRGVEIDLEKDLKGGTYSFAFSVIPNGKQTYIGAGPASSKGTPSNGIILAAIDSAGRVCHTKRGAKETEISNYRICAVNPDQWVDFETVVNLDKMEISYTIKQNGKIIVDKASYPLTVYADGTTPISSDFGIGKVNITQYHNSGEDYIYFDEFIARELVYAAGFENVSTDNIGAYGVVDNSTLKSARIADSDAGHGKSLQMRASGGSNYRGADISLPGKFSSGKYVFNFSVLASKKPMFIGAGTASAPGTPGNSVLLGFINTSGLVLHTDRGNTANRVCSITPTEWVDFETVVDLDNGTVSYTVRQSGRVIVSQFTVPITYGNGGSIGGNFNIERVTVTQYTTADSDVYSSFDNLMISAYQPSPSLEAANVRFNDMLGNSLALAEFAEDIQNSEPELTVFPALNSIALDFGCPVTDESAEGIRLLDSNMQRVEHTAAVEGNKCVLRPSAPLTPQNNYYIHVPAGITARDTGQKLGSEFNAVFATDEIDALVSLDGVTYENGSLMEGDYHAAVGETLSAYVTGINPSDSSETIEMDLIAAWYNDGVLLDMDTQPLAVHPGDMLTEPHRFVVPQSAAEANAFCCFLWNDLSGMVPYGSAVSIPEKSVDGYAKVETGRSIGLTNTSIYNDSNMRVVCRDGKYGRVTSLNDGKLCYNINVDDGFMFDLPPNTPIEVEVEYFDEGTGSFELDYDSNDPQIYGALSADPMIWKAAPVITLSDTKTWKTHTFYLDDMKLGNRCDGGTDLRLGVSGHILSKNSPEDVIFGSITLRRADYKNPIKTEITSRELGNIFGIADKIDLSLSAENMLDEDAVMSWSYKIYDEEDQLLGEIEKNETRFGAKDKKELPLDIENPGKYGIYKIELECETYIVSRPEKIYSETITRDFAVSIIHGKGDGNPRFGVVTSTYYNYWDTTENADALMQKVGASATRSQIIWQRIETSKGVLSVPAFVTQRAMRMHDDEIEFLPVCTIGNGGTSFYAAGSAVPTSDEGIAAFGKYCGELAKGLKNCGVKYYEIWNEYDLPAFNPTRESPEIYVKLLKAARDAIKAVDSEAKIIGMTPSNIKRGPLTWTKQVLAAGAYDYLDIVGLHPYDTHENYFDDSEFIYYMQQVINELKKYDNDGELKPIWFTEFGFSTMSGGFSQSDQADALVLMNAITQGYGFAEKVFQYDLYDRSYLGEKENNWGLVYAWNDNMGNTPRGAKQSFLAMAAYNSFCGRHAEYRDKIVDGGAYAFRYCNDKLGKDVLLLAAGAGRTVKEKQFSLDCSSVDVYDRYGNLTDTLTSANGVYSFTIDQDPLYVVGTFGDFKAE